MGVNDDLVVGGVPMVLGLLGHHRLRGRSASIGPRWSMMRSAADLDTPNSGASWRMVEFVRQYAATSSAGSSSGRPHGRPLRTASAPSRRSMVTGFPKQRGLRPVNGAVQEDFDAVITPVTL